jgi:hypothetical protein
MIEQEKTAAEMLEYYKTEVFGKMGIEIEGLQNKDAAYQKWARVSVADQMLGMDAKGDFARQHVSNFFGHTLFEIYPIKENPLMQEPQEGLAGWLVELMRLLAYLLQNDPFSNFFDLNLLDDRFPHMGDDGTEQFSPSNKELLGFLPAYSRVGALLARMVYAVACIEAQKMDLALYDMYATKCYQRQRRLDFTDTGNCFGYIDCLKDAIEDADFHLTRGRKLDLTIEEIALVDSLWTEVPHHYPENCVVAAREVWQKIKPIREGFGDGRKSKEDCDCFTKDMLEIILPIAEKLDVDMELDDEHSLPLEYVKNWLSGIYYGNDPVFG